MTDPHPLGAAALSEDEIADEVLIAPSDLQDLLCAAYEAGCTAVHDHYQPDPDPSFTEASWDYVASLDFTATTRPSRRPTAPSQEGERLLAELYALVRGECPSLLNEDSGGDAALDLAIQDVLAGRAATAKPVGGEVERARGSVNKAIWLLSDRSVNEATRILDARDELILNAKQALLAPTQGTTPPPSADKSGALYRTIIERDGANPNNRRLIINGTQWAKVYGFDQDQVEARANIIASALSATLAADDTTGPRDGGEDHE